MAAQDLYGFSDSAKRIFAAEEALVGGRGAIKGDVLVLDASMAAKGGGGRGGGPSIGPTEPSDPVVDSYTSGADGGFNITVDFIGTWDAKLKASFIAAADYLSTVITGDLADVDYNGRLIDDIVIEASLTNIDGEGGVLGRAGPTVVRTADYLPVMGVMEFDVADAQAYDADGLFDDIVLHEMLHTLGMGTLWDYKGLVETTVVDDNGTKRPTDDIVESLYTGTKAKESYGGDGMIFVETDGGSGTAGGHWDEETYQLELMTGYIGYFDPDTGWSDANYLSAWSLASLADLGYEVDGSATGLDTIGLA